MDMLLSELRAMNAAASAAFGGQGAARASDAAQGGDDRTYSPPMAEKCDRAATGRTSLSWACMGAPLATFIGAFHCKLAGGPSAPSIQRPALLSKRSVQPQGRHSRSRQTQTGRDRRPPAALQPRPLQAVQPSTRIGSHGGRLAQVLGAGAGERKAVTRGRLRWGPAAGRRAARRLQAVAPHPWGPAPPRAAPFLPAGQAEVAPGRRAGLCGHAQHQASRRQGDQRPRSLQLSPACGAAR